MKCILFAYCRYLDDPWLWDLDWKVRKYKAKVVKPKKNDKASGKVMVLPGNGSSKDVRYACTCIPREKQCFLPLGLLLLPVYS